MSKISKSICEMVSNYVDDEYDLYYGGGESDWGVEDIEEIEEDEPVGEFVPTDWQKEEKEEKEVLMSELYEDLMDMIQQKTDYQYDSSLLDKMIKKEITIRFSDCAPSELYSKWEDIPEIARKIIEKISSKEFSI